MYDISKRICLDNPTVEELIQKLSELPKEAKILCCGESVVYIHVERDNTVVSIDTEELDDEYIDDPETSPEEYWDLVSQAEQKLSESVNEYLKDISDVSGIK